MSINNEPTTSAETQLQLIIWISVYPRFQRYLHLPAVGMVPFFGYAGLSFSDRLIRITSGGTTP